MTDRYAVNLYEQLFIPKPWVSPRAILSRAWTLETGPWIAEASDPNSRYNGGFPLSREMCPCPCSLT